IDELVCDVAAASNDRPTGCKLMQASPQGKWIPHTNRPSRSRAAISKNDASEGNTGNAWRSVARLLIERQISMRTNTRKVMVMRRDDHRNPREVLELTHVSNLMRIDDVE